MITRKDYELVGDFIEDKQTLINEYNRRRDVVRDFKYNINKKERLYINIIIPYIVKSILNEYYIYDEYFLPETIYDINLKQSVYDYFNNIYDNDSALDKDEKMLVNKSFNKYPAIIYADISLAILMRLYNNLEINI